MSKRSEWCEFSPKERAVIYERDNRRCIYCGSTMFLGAAHVFVSRAQGGKGCRENGVLLCSNVCHFILDQGNDDIRRQRIQKYCEDYLHSKYGEIDIESFIYNK